MEVRLYKILLTNKVGRLTLSNWVWRASGAKNKSNIIQELYHVYSLTNIDVEIQLDELGWSIVIKYY